MASCEHGGVDRLTGWQLLIGGRKVRGGFLVGKRDSEVCHQVT